MKNLVRILYIILISMIVNCVFFLVEWKLWYLLPVLLLFFLFVNVFPSIHNFKVPTFRLRIAADGAELLILFLATSVVSGVYHIVMAFQLFPSHWLVWVVSALVAILTESILFWNGIIRVYCTSLQLGIRRRVIGIVCGWIPIANLWALCSIIYVVCSEVSFETQKMRLNQQRQKEQICHTKYPILLVHGVFFRDFKYLNYWGRIPEELKKNGAVLFYGNHHSASSVRESACELTKRIQQIVEETKCEKVNIIAHSKGGLDCRYAISQMGAAPYVASLTTINTPHQGCLFVDYLLNKVSVKFQNGIASKYNSTLKRLGDTSPDFLAAVNDLSSNACKNLNEQMPDSPQVYYQTVGSKLNHAISGKFPLNFSYPLVKHFDGGNDGLVAETSFQFHNHKHTFLTTPGSRGISHGDMIDLNRENIPGFDVREFYVQLVADLKQNGF